jgi:hypothetical protein
MGVFYTISLSLSGLRVNQLPVSTASMGARYVLQLIWQKNHKIDNISTTTKAREKLSKDFP